MSRVRVQFTMSGVNGDALLGFAKSVGLPVDETARRALIWAMNESYRQAAELQKEQQQAEPEVPVQYGAYNTESGITTITPVEVPTLQPTSSDALPHTEDVAASSK